MPSQDDLRQQLNAQIVGRLGTRLGLTPDQTRAVADEVLPAQLQHLTGQGGTAAGAARLQHLAQDLVPAGTVDELTADAGALARLQRAGYTLLPEVMGSGVNADVERIAAQTGVQASSVRQLMALLLPLLLGLLARAAPTAGTGSTLPGATTVEGVAAGSPGAASHARAVPMPVPSPVVVSERVPVTRDERRRRGGAWWLVPVLLVGLGGCYLLQRQPVAAFTVTAPLDAAQVRGPVTLTGTGTPGATVTVTENGAQVATTQIADDGTFQVAVETPAAGEHTYTVAQSGTPEGVTRTVTVAAPAVPPVQAAAPTGELAFTAPAAGATVAAGGLTLRGTGSANTDVTVTEDGVDLGQTRTDASGQWTFDVPAPAAGARVYRAAADGMSSTLNVTVGVGTQTGPCTRAFTLSLEDGQSVTEPFRFGGQGSGKSYVVTVSRGARQVGQKTLLLDASCGWSYTSRPGPGRVTYTLRESGQGVVAGTVTLTVTR